MELIFVVILCCIVVGFAAAMYGMVTNVESLFKWGGIGCFVSFVALFLWLIVNESLFAA